MCLIIICQLKKNYKNFKLMKIVLTYQQSTCMSEDAIQYCSMKTRSQLVVELSILLTVDKCFKSFVFVTILKKLIEI